MSAVVDTPNSIDHTILNVILEIIDLIRHKGDYAKAAILMQDHQLTLTKLISTTLRLSIFDIAKLGDELSKI